MTNRLELSWFSDAEICLEHMRTILISSTSMCMHVNTCTPRHGVKQIVTRARPLQWDQLIQSPSLLYRVKEGKSREVRISITTAVAHSSALTLEDVMSASLEQCDNA